MGCYSDELDKLRMPHGSRVFSPMKWQRAPHLLGRAAWIGSTRALGVLGVRAQTLQQFRQRFWTATAAMQDDDGLAQELFTIPVVTNPPRAQLRVVHVIGSLAAGGAERQLVYLARETVRSGKAEARILLTNPLVGASAHYLPLALEGGVTVEVAGATHDPQAIQALRNDRALQKRLTQVDPRYRPWVTELTGEFLRLRPDVVHAWLDHANIWSAIAALLAGVPHIVLSTRNVNPSNFPMIDAPYFRAWYQRLATSPRVRFIGNSRVGAEDYAQWMGVSRDRFTIIPNGFDPRAMQVPDEGALHTLRAELGLDGRRLVLGVFRIAEEKEPMDFAQAAKEILRAREDACVLVAGDGPMRAALEAHAASIDPTRFRLLGRRNDVAALLSIAEVVVHASRKEGTPNALLEAQALGCPVVATRGGGTVDAVDDGASGYLCPVGDTALLAQRTLELLNDDTLRARMSLRARAFVAERFGLDRMVAESLACYPAAHGGRR